MQAYRDIAQTLKLSGCNDSKIDPCELVLKWLNEDDSGDWLLILDNADDADLFFRSDVSPTTETPTSRSLIDYLPRRLNPQRLLFITTRNRHLGEELVKGELCVEISPFSSQEARELLRSKLREDIDLLDTSSLERLLDVLGRIPLAITQAAAFMNRNSMSLQKYLAALEKDEQNLVDHLSKDLQDHRRDPRFPNSVFRTWKLSFDQIQAQEPSTAKVFSVMAMLDRQQIPESLICNAVERDIDFTTAIGTLVGFSLVSKGINQETFAMHRLVQLSVRQWLEHEDRKEHYARQALQLLANRFPRSDYENWQMCESLLPHAQQVLKHELASKEDEMRRASLLYRISKFHWRQGRYVLAYEAVLKAYNIDREQSGEVATSTLHSLSLLAIVLLGQGKYEVAEEMSQRALKGSEKLHGFEHSETLNSVNNLASVLRNQDKYEAAEEMNQRALKGREKLLGLEHPDTLNSVNNLAVVFQNQGKYEAAEEMYQRALKGSEKLLGLEHRDTLFIINNLASVLRNQGKYEAAEEMNQRALKGREKLLGLEHPDTLNSVNNLALVFQKQGKYEAAEEMNQRALEGNEKLLGLEHPHTLSSVDNLASVFQDQGKYEAAEEMNRRVLKGRENLLGLEHRDTLNSVNNLALVFQKQGKYEAAEEMNQRALEGNEKLLGLEHPHTLSSVNNLASVFQDQGKYEAAEEMNQRALKGREKLLGPEHSKTLSSILSRACLYDIQRKYDDASVLYLRAEAGYLKTLGPDHPKTQNCSWLYASMINKMESENRAR
jgi:tetratricopeptide (TPR) repeat protein